MLISYNTVAWMKCNVIRETCLRPQTIPDWPASPLKSASLRCIRATKN